MYFCSSLKSFPINAIVSGEHGFGEERLEELPSPHTLTAIVTDSRGAAETGTKQISCN